MEKKTKGTMLLPKILINLHTYMYDYTFHRRRKHFSRYCLMLSAEEILKRHNKDCFQINGIQGIKMTKKGEYIKFKKFG